MMRRVLLRNSKLLSPITFSYVRQRDLDEIRDNYGTTKMQKAKMYGAMFAEIAKQGFFGAKKDLSLFL